MRRGEVERERVRETVREGEKLYNFSESWPLALVHQHRDLIGRGEREAILWEATSCP